MLRDDPVFTVAPASPFRLPPTADARAELARRGFVHIQRALSDEAASALALLAGAMLDTVGTAVRTGSGSATLDYRVVTGDAIRARASVLFTMYTAPEALEWLRAVTDRPQLEPSPHLRSSININALAHRGQQYPWHTDAVPFTSVLFLTTLPENAGGELMIRAADSTTAAIRPVRGDLVVMDGARCPHSVAPLREDACRLSIPMVYPAVARERPSGLDEYLYGGAR